MVSYGFISYDGPDSTGQRAEVYVSVATEGKVVNLEDGTKGEVVKAKFTTEKLKYPQVANLRKDDPVYQILVDALANKTPVAYRIESQRKPTIDRSLPITELRATAEIAQENTKSILAGINGILTSEAVTDPTEDPEQSGGRFRAVDRPKEIDSSSPTPQSNSYSRQGNGSSATEEKPWEDYNSDGRVNLGSFTVTGLVGAESKAREHLVEQDVVSVNDFLTDAAENKIHYLTKVLLRVADAVQVAPDHADGGSSRPNRGSNSHTRARGIVYDSLKYLPFTKELGKDDIKEWETRLEALASARFVFAASLVGSPVRGSQPVATGTPAPSSQKAPEKVSEQSQGTSAQFYTPSKEELTGEKATEETVASFIELFKESGIEKAHDLTPLVERTFGVKNVREVADDALGNFVDFYVTEGVEYFTEAVKAAKASA